MTSSTSNLRAAAFFVFSYAVSLEAGGTHGAFEAGSLWQLANTPTVNSAYNVAIGISTGSLNAGGVAQFAQGN